MIELDLPRDFDGRYVLNDVTLNGFHDTSILNESTRSGFVSSIGDGKKRIYCKFKNPELHPQFKVRLFGELLFGQFAKENKIAVANVDAGAYNGFDIILSEDVSKGQMLDLGTIKEHIDEETFEDVNPFMLMSEDVPSTMLFVKAFADKYGLEVDPNLEDDLIKMSLIDYLCFQQDRHQFDIYFNIDEGKISLAKMIDNEYAFLFDGVATFLSSVDHYEGQVLKKSYDIDGESEDVKDVFETLINATRIFCPPKFVYKAHTYNEVLAYENSQNEIFEEEPQDINVTESHNIEMNLIADEFAQMLLEKPKIMQFYNNLDLDLNKFAKNLEKETGVKIPQNYVDFADRLVFKQKRRIERALEKKGEEKGDENNTMLQRV